MDFSFLNNLSNSTNKQDINSTNKLDTNSTNKQVAINSNDSQETSKQVDTTKDSNLNFGFLSSKELNKQPVISSQAPTINHSNELFQRVLAEKGVPPSPEVANWEDYLKPKESEDDGVLATIGKGASKANKFVNEAWNQTLGPLVDPTAQGFRKNFILPAEVAIEDAAEALGIKNDHLAKAELKRVTEQLRKWEHAKEGDFTATDLQGFLFELGLPALKSKKAIAAVEAGLNTLRGISNRGDTTSATSVGFDAGIGAIGGVLGKVGYDKFSNYIKDRWGNEVLSAVQTFAQRKGLSEEVLQKWLEGVPKEQQALTLANRLGEIAHGIMHEASRRSDDASAELLKRVQQRVANVEKVANVGTATEHMNVAKNNYANMIDAVRQANIGINLQGLFKDIHLEKIDGWKNNPITSRLINFEERLAKEPVVNLSEALTLKQDINALAGRALPSEQAVLTWLNKELDKAIEMPGNLPQEFSTLIKTANKDYNKAAQNVELANMIENAKNIHGQIDYGKLAKAIEDKGLTSYEAGATRGILREYEKKFGNDSTFLEKAKGTSPETSALGVLGYLIRVLKPIVYRWGEGGNDLAMQRLILKDLKSSKTPFHMAATVATNQKLPSQVRQEFIQVLQEAKAADLTNYDIKILKGVEPKLVKQTRELNLKVRGAELTVDKKAKAVSSLQERIAKIQKTGGDASNLQANLKIANKELGLAKAKYDNLKTEFDELGTAIENIKGFDKTPKADDLPLVYKKY